MSSHRYIPVTDADRGEMLSYLGLDEIDGLFTDIPRELILQRELDLPDALAEPELLSHMKGLAESNCSVYGYPCFLGAGAYDHFIPSVVSHVLSRSEFYTSYTPYQPEISQGMLQAIFEYQTMICRLTGMDVSNASMYDGATALAEAALIAVRSTGRTDVLVSTGVHPEYREVLKTYARFIGIRVTEVELTGGKTEVGKINETIGESKDCAAIIVQSPNFFGVVEDLEEIISAAGDKKTLSIACVDPISLAILKTPGECGVDIAVGEGQSLGNSLSYGGPYLGFMAVKKTLARKIPGRIVGQTTDKEGRRGFVLTLQAREQHIRREKAVSNICSNQALNALTAVAYLTAMGKEGLQEVAGLCLNKSHYTCERLLKTGAFEKANDGPFFKEFAVRALNEPVESINKRLLDNKILGGLDLGRYYRAMKNCWLVAVTEKRTLQEIDAFVQLAAGGGK